MFLFSLKPEVLYVFDHVALSSREICGTILRDSCGGGTYDPFNQTWTVNIPGNKPPLKPYRLPPVSQYFNILCYI